MKLDIAYGITPNNMSVADPKRASILIGNVYLRLNMNDGSYQFKEDAL